jgi:catechol 2,3-dioxygenase-like lactoylglutathione lyase family enzyme
MIESTRFVLEVPDLAISSAFYKDVLGFQTNEMGEFGLKTIDGHRIMVGSSLTK